MALFDSIISGAAEKFDLGDKAGTLLSAILALMTNQETGGFLGFMDRFKQAGLSDTVASWITGGDNVEISDDEVSSALGSDAIQTIADQTGLSSEKTTSAIGYMLPQVVDTLTPDGEVPDQESLLSKIGGFLTGIGGTAAGVVTGAAGSAGAVAGGAVDKASDAAESVGDAAEAAVDKEKEVVGDAASAVSGKVGSAFDSVGDAFDGDGDGGNILKWLLPLLLLGLLLALGFMFCSKNPDANKTGTADSNSVDSNSAESHNAGSNDNGDTANAGNSNVNAEAGDANDAERKLSEVSLPGDVKLQAYPGGIEDQLIKFVESDEYKNATDEQLKDKWFDFDDLNFKFGTTELEANSKRQLDNIVAILKAFPDAKIKIGGYTDKKGDDAGNKKLSDDRAKAVKAALDKAGVGAQVPEAEGYGEEFAKVAEDASDEERAPDRKTSVRLLK